MPRTYCAMLLLSLTISLSACTSFGPKRIPGDHVSYNEAVARAANEQMLLNLVRLRYQHVPVFLAVNSVLTQYTYLGQAGVAGSSGSATGNPLWSVGGNAAIIYAERPTVTFAPLTGDEFAQQLLRPMPQPLLFSLVQSGWPPEQLLIMGLERINHLENISFDFPDSPENLARVRTFHRVVRLMIELARHQAIEMQTDDTTEPQARYLVIEANADPETQGLIEEFKRLVDLAPEHSLFRVTTNLTRRKPDEITIRMRSILAMMGYVSRGVEVPTIHLQEKRAMEMGEWADIETRDLLFPIRIYSLDERPPNVYVAVQYENHWFYLKPSDQRSKTAFSLLAYLFQLQAPTAQAAGPLLTLPAGQ